MSAHVFVRLLTVAAFTLLVSAIAHAQASGDPAAGLSLARQWCTSCHLVEPAGRGGQSGPTFLEIANSPDRTRPTLQAWLTDPHPPMPNLNLSNKEINDVIAYLESLRGRM